MVASSNKLCVFACIMYIQYIKTIALWVATYTENFALENWD